MRYMMMTKNDPNNPITPPSPEMFAAMDKLIEEMSKAGVLLATGGLGPNPTQVISSGGKVTVTDGPFTEAKEAVVGFALVEAKSKEEAIEFSRRFWQAAGDGAGEIYEVFGG
ncbi:MAG: YciI family protein [Chloroflexota bacterium]|nr:YciI family protein [Chloroflexota bacterium]